VPTSGSATEKAWRCRIIVAQGGRVTKFAQQAAMLNDHTTEGQQSSPDKEIQRWTSKMDREDSEERPVYTPRLGTQD